MTVPPANIVYQRRRSRGVLTLGGVIDIGEATALRAAALRALNDASAAEMRVDFADVERVDASAMQILAALRREIEAGGRSWQAENMPPALQSALARLGLRGSI